MKFLKPLILLLFIYSTFSSYSQLVKKTWLPKEKIVDAAIWDPLAGQMGGALSALWEEGKFQEEVYATFVFGMQRSFFSLDYESGLQFDIGLDFGAFTQFEFKGGKQNILNTDFKMGIPITWRINNSAWRINLYHISTHFGDDYVFKYDIPDYDPDPLTYEQIDFTYYQYAKGYRYYVGVGIVVQSVIERKLLSFHGGIDGSKFINTRETIKLLYGAHINLDEQTNYRLGIKPGVGLQFGKKEQKPINLILEFYTGPSPYGTYENVNITYLGLGMYFSPF